MKKGIFLYPFLYSLLFALANYLFVLANQSELTYRSQELLDHRTTAFFLACLMIVIPNFILSIALLSFIQGGLLKSGQPLAMMIFGIVGGTLPTILIFHLYYFDTWMKGLAVPVLMFGFPFTYLFGMAIGLIIGLTFFRIRNRKG